MISPNNILSDQCKPYSPFSPSFSNSIPPIDSQLKYFLDTARTFSEAIYFLSSSYGLLFVFIFVEKIFSKEYFENPKI